MRLPAWLRMFAHRRGWIASPALAFRGVPFGPQKRDLAGEVMARIARSHDPQTCPVCSIPDEEWP
ncbi:hypothetical protein ACFWXA_30860 [Streptomyces atroolivaceus]|uniref:hypothetical protein n=1 Tax=Streptomyces atroolivaceus TaxID=66869 RepID=UPI00365C31D2